SDRGRAAGAQPRTRARALRALGAAARGAAAVRTRLHLGGAAASRLADGGSRGHARHPTAQPLSAGTPARHPARAGVRVAFPGTERKNGMNLLSSFLFAFVFTSAPAQSTSALPRQVPAAAAAPQANDAAASRYLIGPQDLLKITVLDEPELTNNYRVDSDGVVTLP